MNKMKNRKKFEKETIYSALFLFLIALALPLYFMFSDFIKYPSLIFAENEKRFLAALPGDNSYAYVHAVFGPDVERACFFSGYSDDARKEYGIDWWEGDGIWTLVVETVDGDVDVQIIGRNKIDLLKARCIGPDGIMLSILDPPGNPAGKYVYPMEVEDFVFALNINGKLPVLTEKWYRGVNKNKAEYVELPNYSR